jgi:hypothetical protein
VNDTPDAIEARVAALFAARSGGERVRMACEMFATARALMVAEIRQREPDLSDAELRVRIFERTYGGDLDPSIRARIIARLRGSRTVAPGHLTP